MGLKLRAPRPAEAAAIGGLMHDAYRGTLDDEGEDVDAAVAAARGYFEGRWGGPAMPKESVVAWRGNAPVGGCLVGHWEEEASPFVAFVFTTPLARGAGVGRLLLSVSVRRLSRAGHRQVLAVITRGNTPSERLFASLGFSVFRRWEEVKA